MTEILERALKKAAQSRCRYKVAAIGFNRKGEVVGITYNQPRFKNSGGSVHAEINLLRRFGPYLKQVMVVRVGQSGLLRPIDPCPNCRDALKGIKIVKAEDNG
jgi:tRNA(Arg) A34 adenosine deaminase TadA